MLRSCSTKKSGRRRVSALNNVVHSVSPVVNSPCGAHSRYSSSVTVALFSCSLGFRSSLWPAWLSMLQPTSATAVSRPRSSPAAAESRVMPHMCSARRGCSGTAQYRCATGPVAGLMNTLSRLASSTTSPTPPSLVMA